MSAVTDKGGAGDAGDMLQYGEMAKNELKDMRQWARNDLDPWRETGNYARGALAVLLGATPDTSSPEYGALRRSFTNADFVQDPGYQFRLGEGQKAIDRQMAAAGKYMTPEAAKALGEYNQGFASNEYNNAYARYNQNQNNIFDRLMALSGQGQQAATGQASAALNTGTQLADLSTQQGNAITAAREAARNRSSSFFNTLVGAGALALSDIRLKTDITPLGTENGHNIYSFVYKADPSRKFIGVMAQEVRGIIPEAVIEYEDGTLAVDYDLIGVKFREVGHAA